MRLNIEERMRECIRVWLDDATFTLFLEQDMDAGLDLLLAEKSPLEMIDMTVIGASLASKEKVIPGWAVYGLVQNPFIGSKYHNTIREALRMDVESQLQYTHVKLTEKSAGFFKDLQQFLAMQGVPSYMTAMVLDKPEMLLWGYNPSESIELTNPDLEQKNQKLAKYFKKDERPVRPFLI